MGTKTVAIHPGTGTDVICDLGRDLGFRVNLIECMKDIAKSKHDHLLLLGGGDISPFWYGERNIYCADNMNWDRDNIEWALIRRAMTGGTTIMGICRGHQMVAVAYGGSLYQDIYRQKVTGYHPKTHYITVTGPLAMHLASTKVNSFHHQAIKTVPDGFRVAAKSDEGVIEAIYKPGVLGVQFHPELMIADDHRWTALFSWFLEGLR